MMDQEGERHSTEVCVRIAARLKGLEEVCHPQSVVPGVIVSRVSRLAGIVLE
jgi:hypothetical protein